MPFFPQLPEIKTPQLFKGDIPTLLKDMSQLRSEAQLREMRDVAMEKERATALSPEDIRRERQLGIEQKAQDIDIKQIKKTEALMNLGIERLKTVQNVDQYNALSEEMVSLGASPTIFPEIESDEDLQQYKDDIRQDVLLWKEKAGKGTPLQKLYSQLDVETNPQRRSEIQKAINKEIGVTPETEQLTLYNKDGRTKRITRTKGSDFNPSEIYGKDWSLKAPSKTGETGGISEYLDAPEKLVDDTRGYYSIKMKTLLDDMGYVKDGSEDEYRSLTEEMDEDFVLIREGKTPKWLGGETKLPEGLTQEMLNQYKKRYPGRNEEEIIEAWGNR